MKKKNWLRAFLNRSTEEEMQDVHYKGNPVVRLLGYMKPYRKVIALCIVLVLCTTALQLVQPIITGNAIDQYITADYAPGEQASQRLGGLLRAAGLYVLVLAGLFVCNRYRRLLLQRTGQDIVYDLRNQLFAHVSGLDMRFFDTTPVGKIVTRITNDAESINEVYSNVLVQLVLNVSKIIGYAAVMLALNARMALYSFIFMPLVIALTAVFRTLARKAFRLTKTRVTALNTFLSEHISGMRLIKVFGRELFKHSQFCQRSADLYKANQREIMVNATFRPLIYWISIAALCVVLCSGSDAVLRESITIGTLYVFIRYIQSFFEPIQELTEQLSTLQGAIASAEKIFTLLDEEPTVLSPREPYRARKVRGSIVFDHVWFAYKGEEWVLKDVSFVIEPGQKIAFVGATGAGKSSILNLIGRYYDIQKGRILVDGVDIRQWDLQCLRGAIGLVQQDVYIFTGDIADNIRLWEDSITDRQMRVAAERVNAARFIDRLPAKYHEPVSERGSTLSAGQRQLLSFARTLAKDPEILILDEATANIDTETEQWIQEAMEEMMKGRTSVMVAHRLSTIRHADRILVMHHGRVMEEGTHEQLIARDGIYKKLYELQCAS